MLAGHRVDRHFLGRLEVITTDAQYADLLARLGIKLPTPTFSELIEELGEATW